MNERRINWCGRLRHIQDPHFAVLGTPGSGKSLNITLLQDSVLGPGPEPRVHSAIFDPKLELYPYLRQRFDAHCIHLIHPIDERAVRWDVKTDVHNRARAIQVADALIPEVKDDKQPYFRDTARRLLRETMNSYRLRGLNWTLNDLLQGCGDPETVQRVLAAHRRTEFLNRELQGSETARKDVHSTLSTTLSHFELTAACHARNTNQEFSARSWLAQPPSIILLPYDATYDKAIAPLNRAIFRYLVDEILHQPAGQETETWAFFDEARLAGQLPGLVDLMRTGRSKGAHVVLGIQDVPGFFEVHGEWVGKELLGLCGNKLFLRITEPMTARYASDCFGSAPVVVKTTTDSKTQSRNGDSTTQTTNRVVQDARIILERDFTRLLSPSKERALGYQGFAFPPVPEARSKEVRPRYQVNRKYRVEVDAEYLDRELGEVPSPEFLRTCPAFQPVADERMERLDWSEREREYFLGAAGGTAKRVEQL